MFDSINTSKVQVTISYYVHDGSNVYGFSKPFDHVNYCTIYNFIG